MIATVYYISFYEFGTLNEVCKMYELNVNYLKKIPI